MIKLFPRKKPIPVPNIKVTPEYLAKGMLKNNYNKTKLAFNVPWMGVVAMAFANYPYFYNALWKYMYPLSKSSEFNKLCKRLIILSKKKAKELKPKSIIKGLKAIGYSNYEIKQIDQVNHVFTEGNMPYLIMASLARIFIEGGEIINNKSFSKYNKVICKKENLLLMEFHHADIYLKSVYKSVKANLGLPFLNTDYRAFARWPSYFILSWKNLLPILSNKEYNNKVLEIHNFIIKETLSLPNPNKVTSAQIIDASKKDKKLDQIKNIISLFQWLLPGLVTNIAIMKEQIK